MFIIFDLMFIILKENYIIYIKFFVIYFVVYYIRIFFKIFLYVFFYGFIVFFFFLGFSIVIFRDFLLVLKVFTVKRVGVSIWLFLGFRFGS